MAEEPLSDWSSGLFDCFEEANSCCYGFWCCPCLAYTVSRRFGENSCLPLCDVCNCALMTCGIPLVAPPAAIALRSTMRSRYGIKGSLCNDIAVSCFCVWCSWCQMYREMKDRKDVPIINAQYQTVINVQPSPVMMRPTSPALLKPAF